ncbi:MAG TPA: magnesium/cobalt transporter CorA [Gemmatimonadaceae bacterium]|nr:magnesium/cobalt transporter CorA [Gemmatimonadaceae bacterium]
MSEAVRSNGGQLWVDIDSSAHAQLALLETVFHFHPLAIEDTLNPRTRVKLEEYPGYLFMVVRVVDFEDETEERYDVRSHNVYFFLGQNYLVTVHAGHARSCGEIVQQLDRNPELLGRGAERLMHAIMDMAVDAYFPLLDRIDDATHQIEERVFVEANPATLREIFAVKRLVLALRKYLAPQRDVFNVLTNRPSVLLSPESQVYFRDIHDHVLRITESLETYRELLSGALDAYLTQASNQLAVVTKGLTVVATLSIPFVMVSGIWGMNFARIPLSHTTYGFWLLLGAQVALGVGLLALLRWRRWL